MTKPDRDSWGELFAALARADSWIASAKGVRGALHQQAQECLTHAHLEILRAKDFAQRLQEGTDSNA